MSLRTKLKDWEELQASVESGEIYLRTNLTQWWNGYVDQTAEVSSQNLFPMTLDLELKMIQQPDNVIVEIINQIKAIEVGQVINLFRGGNCRFSVTSAQQIFFLFNINVILMKPWTNKFGILQGLARMVYCNTSTGPDMNVHFE